MPPAGWLHCKPQEPQEPHHRRGGKHAVHHNPKPEWHLFGCLWALEVAHALRCATHAGTASSGVHGASRSLLSGRRLRRWGGCHDPDPMEAPAGRDAPAEPSHSCVSICSGTLQTVSAGGAAQLSDASRTPAAGPQLTHSLLCLHHAASVWCLCPTMTRLRPSARLSTRM